MSAAPRPSHPHALPLRSAERSVHGRNAANDGGNGSGRPQPSRRKREDSRAATLARCQAVVLNVLAEFIGAADVDAALLSVANVLKANFRCTRVTIGLSHTQRVRVAAVSQQANVDEQTAEIDLLRAAMQECHDSGEMVIMPAAQGKIQELQAHRQLLAGRTHRQVFSIPLTHRGQAIAVLLLERESTKELSARARQLLVHIAVVLTPLIVQRQLAEQGLVKHLQLWMRKASGICVAPRYIKLKLSVVALACALILAWLIDVPIRVRADAELVPLARRVISAPQEGYISTIERDAGDRVDAGDALLQLDTADLQSEQSRAQSELAAANAELRSAMASGDRRRMAMIDAEISKHQAQLNLIRTRLQRAVVRAPVAGVIVSGDLSQKLGAPVERGELLLEIAPPQGYDVHLMLDESDIHRVSVGDRGRLSLKAMPGQAIDFTVSAIHPVGIAEQGRNRFRVEATLDTEQQPLLPGQTGVGKVVVGRASLLWSLTHEFGDWLRQKIWEWFG